MKITTWNVNGLRAALNKGAAEWWNTDPPDVLCLQEIKVQPEQLSSEHQDRFEVVDVIWNPAQRKGYSGVATLLWTEALQNSRGLGFDKYDTEGRVIQTKFEDFTLFNVYFPNGQRGHERLQFKLDFYAALLDICDQMHTAGERIVITGDFNTAHKEIDLKNPKENQKTSGFMPVEREWVTRYLEHGFVDAYRQLYPDRVQYTWWTYRVNARQRNIGWRLDYFLVSESLMPHLLDVIIHEDVLGSDHCPVTLLLD
jgi:exodeoxyribonuclease-3